jgi:hypothetical protein
MYVQVLEERGPQKTTEAKKQEQDKFQFRFLLKKAMKENKL